MFERSWMRFDGLDQSARLVRADGSACSARILNESYSGMGLKVADTPALAAGEAVEVEHPAGSIRARVCHVTPTQDGGLRVGIEWLDRPLPASA